MIEVSIVSGTYNRLASLKRMVTSVRMSVCTLPYEIVLVDGGSTDGTIEWCIEQPDVVLVQQGKLLGAVKAFNEGARTANGNYVILANDDIYFIDESIIRAYRYMQDYPNIGIGCFYQNRNDKDWHVEHMHIIVDGQPRTAPYGQVCIVPRHLGNKLNWWGDYLHTYGGDNELSCKAYEAMYKVAPLECCCIADLQIDDGLREINGGDPRAHNTIHPDSKKWRDKWYGRGRKGAAINTNDVRDCSQDMVRKLRILYAPLFEPGNIVQRMTKRGLRDSLQRQGVVVEFDYMRYGMDLLYDWADAFQPDLFIFQIQNINPFNASVIRGLRHEHPNAIFVNWNGDFHSDNFTYMPYVEMLAQFDLVGTVTTEIKKLYDHHNVPWFYWQIGYEESDAEPLETTPRHDVVFLGNGYSKARLSIGAFLRSLEQTGLSVGLYGSWPEKWASGETLYDFDEGRRLYRNAKFGISTQQWPDSTGFVSNRLFQAMAAGGCLVLQERFDGMEELLGIMDNVHLRVWDTHDDLLDLISYYSTHDDERKILAAAGTKYILSEHSFDRRVQELFRKLDDGIWM